jgi:hypothetical protein
VLCQPCPLFGESEVRSAHFLTSGLLCPIASGICHLTVALCSGLGRKFLELCHPIWSRPSRLSANAAISNLFHSGEGSNGSNSANFRQRRTF